MTRNKIEKGKKLGIRLLNEDLESHFPLEHLGIGERFLLNKIIEEEVKKRVKQKVSISNYTFIAGVCIDMEMNYGIRTRQDYFDFG